MRHKPNVRFWRTPFDSEAVRAPRGTIHVQEERCKGCFYCVEFCPNDVLGRSHRYNHKGYHPPDVVHADDCYACHLCEILCPEFAITIQESDPRKASHAS